METLPTHKDLEGLIGNFDIEQGIYRFERINQGYINNTYLVLKNKDPFYVLQRINCEVFPNITAVMGNITKALPYLHDKRYASVGLIPTKSGESYCEIEDSSYWRLWEYVPYSTAYNNAKNPAMAFEAGRILGQFHTLLQHAPTEQFEDTIPLFHNLQLREAQFAKAVKGASKEKLLAANAAISFVNSTLDIFSELSQIDLPLRLCHNDTKMNNILFSKESNKALCFIDLDTLMKGYFYYDFGDLVRTIANVAQEDEREHRKISFDKELFEAFLDGLATNDHFLTSAELQSLPLGTVFMPFIHGLRALTDYLNNNQYYKVSYPNQNLDRSLSLFDFSKKALNELAYMQELVAKKWKLFPH
ncbi:phosphotransferase enzyme family protein [Sediminicola sp. 1XM1-17]|uniref:phosphotransferase enzyme family protein n=1 Tax=Sediminicola sp. 1XM1-17 TaxID=3127702 RepID=UPI003077D03C